MSVDLRKAEALFADILTASNKRDNRMDFNISAGLVHLAKGLQQIEAKLDALLEAQQREK